jgi:hypothetical protein
MTRGTSAWFFDPKYMAKVPRTSGSKTVPEAPYWPVGTFPPADGRLYESYSYAVVLAFASLGVDCRVGDPIVKNFHFHQRKRQRKRGKTNVGKNKPRK